MYTITYIYIYMYIYIYLIYMYIHTYIYIHNQQDLTQSTAYETTNNTQLRTHNIYIGTYIHIWRTFHVSHNIWHNQQRTTYIHLRIYVYIYIYIYICTTSNIWHNARHNQQHATAHTQPTTRNSALSSHTTYWVCVYLHNPYVKRRLLCYKKKGKPPPPPKLIIPPPTHLPQLQTTQLSAR